MKDNIFSQILSEIDEFLNTSIEIVPGYSFNQYETLKRIYLYYNSKFETGEYDSEGFKKYFYNLSRFRCQVASKAIDLDTKDINIIPEEGQSEYACWFFEKEFRQWMKEKGFGKCLNRIITELPIYGTVVAKRAKGDAEKLIVDLRNLFVEQTADCLKRARYIIEKHYFTPEELAKKKDIWENVDLAIELHRSSEYSSFEGTPEKESVATPYIVVWERYGEVPESWLREDGDPNKYVKAVFIVTGLQRKKGLKGEDTGIILYKDEVEDYPYEEVHWLKIPGRWLGMGLVEELFEPQMRVNEVVNLQAKGLWWTSLKIFQTRDESINRNLLSDVVNGEIINVTSEITPIVNEERNLSAYQIELQRWENLANQMGFTFAPVTGERLPSGTPLGSAILQTQLASSFFDLKREEVGMFVKRIIWNLLIPQFKEEKSAEHIVSLIGTSSEELSKLHELRFNYEYNQRIIEWILENKDIPDYREAKVIELAVREKVKGEKFITIPEKFYDDLKYKIDIVITGERIDVAAKMSTLQVALQLLNANPMLVKDPQLKKIFYRLLQLAGIDPIELEVAPETTAPEEEIIQTVPQGGSISLPRPGAVPPIITETTTA